MINVINYTFRYQFILSYPISKPGANTKILLSIGDEILINAGKEIVYNIFDQNRILLGTTFQLNNNFALTFTYNYQFKSLNSPNEFKQEKLELDQTTLPNIKRLSRFFSK